MAEEKLDVVGCGSMVVDLFYRTPRIIRADEKILLRPHTASAAIEQNEKQKKSKKQAKRDQNQKKE